MRILTLLLAVSLLGCANSRTQIRAEDGEQFAMYHHIGILPFSDTRGQGAKLADSLSDALAKQRFNETVDRSLLEQSVKKFKVTPETGIGVEALEEIRGKTAADAILFGKMTPDWSAARVVVLETEMGGAVLSALVRPKGREKVFANADEVSTEIMRAFSRVK